jgi:ankyrin repeat domain-containing protein 50
MDPLSVTASAIAIIQISGTIISLCYDYRSRVKNATKEASRIVNELNGLRSVIDSLLLLLEDESEKSSQNSALISLRKATVI